MSESTILVEHSGSCHCGKVKYTVQAPAENLIVYTCDCSICNKKQNRHFIVPKSNFKLLSLWIIKKGEEYLTTYEFNTKAAKHMFCKICGVQSFYQPRSNPDGYGIMPHCIDSNTIKSISERFFAGSNWEQSIKADTVIHGLSKN